MLTLFNFPCFIVLKAREGWRSVGASSHYP
ncbi:hypothetical protein F383_31055 [Gossypium arboreum]|uniref:Uncharacterized protein n=1 Tax=Gossypium arboreum TaxID=29729 RepID=A0A0B0MZY5_GOSAR|nr:hypothetical protein F383_31055 [Gossypium arboreum]